MLSLSRLASLSLIGLSVSGVDASWLASSLDLLRADPDQRYVVASNDTGFTLHDSQTLRPSYVISSPDASAQLFSADGKRLYFTESDKGLFALELETGEVKHIATIPTISGLFLSDDGQRIVTMSSEPGQWETERLVLHAVDASGKGDPQQLAVLEPAKMRWIEHVQTLPARQPDRMVLVLRDADEPTNQWDSRSWGVQRFVELDLQTGNTKVLSTLAEGDTQRLLDSSLRWTNDRREVLEWSANPDYAYTLIDPYSGKIVRELKVPGVEFHLHEPGQVIAYREAQENGATQLYRDYLESGTLKTLRNVAIPDRDAWPERERAELPESYFYATTIRGDVVGEYSRYGEPYRLLRLDPQGKTVASYDAGGSAPYGFENFAFHPTRPEFFAFDEEEGVHLFRTTSSGLKHQARGPAAWEAQFTADGEQVLFHGLFDPPLEQLSASDFPSSQSLVYESPPQITTDPIYVSPPVISPSGQWIIALNNRDTTLHRLGEAPIIHSLGGVVDGTMPEYLFAADEQGLARLIWSVTWDDYDVEQRTATLELLPFPTTEDYPQPLLSVALPHPHYQLIDYPAAEVRLIDLQAGELATVSTESGEIVTTPIAGLKPAEGESGPFFFDSAKLKVYLARGSTLVEIDLSTATPTARQQELESKISQLHRYGDGRHIVAVLDTGALVFVEPESTGLRVALQMQFYGPSGSYLAESPAGYFDASAAIRDTGYLLRGTRPTPLKSLFERAYQPDLLVTALGADAVGEDEPLPAYIQPPRITDFNSRWVSALQHRLFVNVEARQHPLTELRVYQNDKLVQSLSRSEFAASKGRIEVELLLEENRFYVTAIDEAGVSATSETLVLNPPQALLEQKLAERRAPHLHLLVVGVNEYRNREYNLNFAVADAQGIRTLLESANRDLFEQIETHQLSDAEATHDGILAAFERVKAAAQPQDVFIFYFAGHGVMSQANQQFYLIPHDVTRIYGESQSLTENGIAAHQLQQLSASIRAQKQLFILDACNSGGALQAFAQRGASQEKALAQLARATGTHWIAASSASQFATEFADLGHGAFTHTLIQGLGGEADAGDRRVTVNELKAYLEAELPEVTQRYKGAPQYPASYGYGQDFPVALLP
ncbi:MAG: caspase family protein [Verrucomicrobiota bacterium JB022]|nr:caspase family protein [Verrucomicrobiota bacterium JB022]